MDGSMSLSQGFARIMVQVSMDAGEAVDPENAEHRVLAMLVAGAMNAVSSGDIGPEAFQALAMGAWDSALAHLRDKDPKSFPEAGTRCSMCQEPQFKTPSGDTCKNGAPPLEEEGRTDDHPF